MYQDKSNFFKGAVIGGLTAGITGLLLAPKSGKEIRDEIADSYNSVSKRTHDLTSELIEKGRYLLNGSRPQNHHSSMLMGILIGGAITTIATLLLAPESGKKLRSRLGNQYDSLRSKAEDFVANVGERGHDAVEYLDDWKDALKLIVNKLSSNSKKHKSETFDQVLEWANLGLGVLQQLQKRR